MVGEIIIWIIGVGGFLLFLLSIRALRINEKELKELQRKIDTTNPWESTGIWEKMKDGTEKANARAVILAFISGFISLTFIVYLLSKWGLF